MKKRNAFLLMSLLLVIGLIAGSTFAYWTWYSSENKDVVFNTVGNVSDYIVYNEGSSHFVGDFQPEDSYCESVNTTLSFYKKNEAADIGFLATIHMDINAIGDNISQSDDVHWVVTTGDNTVSCSSGLNGSEIVAHGTFSGRVMGESIVLVRNIEVTLIEQKYTVWIWLDSSGTNLSNLSGETIDANVWTRIDMVDSEGTNINNGNTYTISFDANGGEISTLYTDPGEHVYTVPSTGTYKLEVWGAQGGTGMKDGKASYSGGYGGYSVGTVTLIAGTELYANVGGKGENAADKQAGGAGGYNGGGTGGNETNYSSSGANEPGSGGGGASHIATQSGVLSLLENNKNSVLIVAGGGGGGNYSDAGGHGGGYIGVAAASGSNMTEAGAQNSGNAFGLGGVGTDHTSGGGGGGSGFYGGYGGGYGGSGGSGYIGNSLLTNKVMYCYNCTRSSEPNTLTNTTTKVSETPVSNYAKSGNGAIRITKVSDDKKVTNGSTYGTLPTPTREGYVFIGWNTKSDGMGETITSETVVNLNSNRILYAIWSEENSEEKVTTGQLKYTIYYAGEYNHGTVTMNYSVSYNSLTNQSIVKLTTSALRVQLTANTTGTTTTTFTITAKDSGDVATSSMNQTLTKNSSGFHVTYPSVTPSTVVVSHSNDGPITLSIKGVTTHKCVDTSSGSKTINFELDSDGYFKVV